MELFIHIGAPRTGTSFLRKWVFPYFEDITFYNKQGVLTEREQTVVNFFSALSHYGDGDELSNRLSNIKCPSFPNKKILISEEHLIWSVYHMLGNIGSRALLIKKYYPNAKIILTIRRQPEYFLSIFKYLKSLDNSHIENQMKSILNMINSFEELSSINVSRYGKFPVGAKLETQLSLFDIDQYYFNRRLRHFISADFSWFRIHEIYTELFGRNNVLVLPQEMLVSEPHKYIDKLSGFLGSQITSDVKSGKRENRSPDVIVFKSEKQAQIFKDFILSINFESNFELNKVLNGCLEKYGYCKKGSNTITQWRIGLETNNNIKFRSDHLKKIKLYYDRLGYFFTIKVLLVKLKSRIKSRVLIKGYYKFSSFIEALQGLDFSQIESLDDLNLQRKNSEQYETTKIFEFKKWLEYLPEDVEYNAIDFGSGKGAVLVALSKSKNFKKIYGIEISERLASIARKNLDKKHVHQVNLLIMDAVDTPKEIIDDCNLFYFYNPFPYKIFRSVFDKIEVSLQRNDRDAMIIYFKPVHYEIIEDSEFFMNTHRLKNPLSNADTYIYRSCFRKKQLIPSESKSWQEVTRSSG